MNNLSSLNTDVLAICNEILSVSDARMIGAFPKGLPVSAIKVHDGVRRDYSNALVDHLSQMWEVVEE